MALITCPECGREISDRVRACPHCGYPFEEDPPAISDAKDNQSEVSETDISETPATKKKTKTIIPIAAIAVLAIIIAVIVSGQTKAQKAAETRAAYISDLKDVRIEMLAGAAAAETQCNLTVSVWRNCINKESDVKTDKYTRENTYGSFYSDFNDALLNLYKDESTLDAVLKIEVNQDKVAEIIKRLQNPPDDMRDCYDTMDKMYDAYQGLTGLAVSPTGSLTSYSSDFHNYDETFMLLYNKMELQIPEQ